MCRGLAWLMDPTPDAAKANEPRAKDLCRTRCPVIVECLSWAFDLTDETDPGGIVGGFNELERRELRAELHEYQQQRGAA